MNKVETQTQNTESVARRRATILVGEDDSDDALLLERAFHDVGVQSGIHFATDSRTVVHFLQGAGEYADRERFPLPTLLLLDLKLGVTNGLEVLHWLQEHADVRRSMVVIILTGSDSKELVEMSYHLGANSYLVKPMDYHELVAMARAVSEFWLRHNVMP